MSDRDTDKLFAAWVTFAGRVLGAHMLRSGEINTLHIRTIAEIADQMMAAAGERFEFVPIKKREAGDE